MRAFGADESSFRLDPTVHPFCTSFSVTDVRLTTRYAEDDLTGHSLFSTMHEVGHGLYEHGVDPSLERSPLAHGCSSALHESQSRLWENVVGRSLPFWRWFYPRMQAAHPDALGDVSLERVPSRRQRRPPGFIRVDADETTYGLHIILRFEIEQELLVGQALDGGRAGRLERALRGVPRPRPCPTTGSACLQDVHWSFGGFGYFPTYQLGNVLSVQIWERLREDLGDTDALVERGEFAADLRAGCASTSTRSGSRFTPAETIERVAGGPIDPEPYLRYLDTKFGSPVTVVDRIRLQGPDSPALLRSRSRTTRRRACRCRRGPATPPASTRCSPPSRIAHSRRGRRRSSRTSNACSAPRQSPSSSTPSTTTGEPQVGPGSGDLPAHAPRPAVDGDDATGVGGHVDRAAIDRRRRPRPCLAGRVRCLGAAPTRRRDRAAGADRASRADPPPRARLEALQLARDVQVTRARRWRRWRRCRRPSRSGTHAAGHAHRPATCGARPSPARARPSWRSTRRRGGRRPTTRSRMRDRTGRRAAARPSRARARSRAAAHAPCRPSP